MKFGDTLYHKSIPQWAPYNVDYNSLKRLIKTRTTDIATTPVAIPGQGPSTEAWKALEDELFPILTQEHYRSSLFIRSKFGEIDRRLAHVEKQARLAEERKNTATSRPIQQNAKYQRLVEEADRIGNDTQSLSRFASAQRLAFKKILKKYRKWTGSSSLQIRMNNELLGQHASSLNPEFDPYLSRLTKVTSTIRRLADDNRQRPSKGDSSPSMKSRLARAQGTSHRPVDFESAFAMPLSFPKVIYWIHREDLDEAKILLMRHMKRWEPNTKARDSSSKVSNTFIAVLGKPKDAIKPEDGLSGLLSCRWTGDEDSFLIDHTNSQHGKPVTQVIRHKELSAELQKKATQLEPLALIQCLRERFIQDDANPILATLETSVSMAPCDARSLEDAVDFAASLQRATNFPHAILTICYAETTAPELVSAFDQSHLAQMVPGFCLESHAIYTIGNPSTSPRWQALLDSDIRKTPTGPVQKRLSRTRIPVTNSSGPSSTDGPADSIYSQPERYSSNTSVATVTPVVSPVIPKSINNDSPLDAPQRKPQRKHKHRHSYGTVQEVPPQRYWNEFDDEPEFNNDESYAIYVTPDEPFQFPGSETISKGFSRIFRTLKRSKILSWPPFLGNNSNLSARDEQEGLLASPTETIEGYESSSDELEMAKPIKTKDNHKHRAYRVASRSHSDTYSYPRRSSRDQLLSFTAMGLHILSLLILLLATVLKSTGRKKAAVEVDAGVITGIVVALGCGVFAVGCAIARRAPVSMAEWVLVSVLGLCEFVWGICLGIWVAEATTL